MTCKSGDLPRKVTQRHASQEGRLVLNMGQHLISPPAINSPAIRVDAKN
jgi:hypothetical protein